MSGAGWVAMGFGLGVLSYAAVLRANRRPEPAPPVVDAAAVRAEALADAWYMAHTARTGPHGGGPDSFYHGCKTAEWDIEKLPGYDHEVSAVSALQIRANIARNTRSSGRIRADGPGGVGSTNRGLTPTTGTDGSEG